MADILDEICRQEESYIQKNIELEGKCSVLEQEAEQMLNLHRERLFAEDSVFDDSFPAPLKSFEELRETLPSQPLHNARSATGTGKSVSERSSATSIPHATDVLLELSPDISNEAMVRLLKAKIRVLQEEAEKFAEDNRRLTLENVSLTNSVKHLEDSNGRVQRAAVGHQQTADKMKQQLEAITNHGAQFEIECSALRKEVDTLKKSQKQSVSSQNMTEVRLNRALEQSDKYRQQLQKTQQSKKEIYSQEQKKVDEILVENRRLQKQKNDLMIAFKKQMKLIDILKRQKMHLEASKVLEFTEAEFLKAIDWKD